MNLRSGCPGNAAVEALGDQWLFLVPRDMIFGDRRDVRELFHGSIEGIVSGNLTREDAVHGQRARYSLTEAAIRTLPVTVASTTGGLDWRTGSPEPRRRQVGDLPP